MEKEKKLSKGEHMEELLRNYFLNSGYYVVRGVKYRYENNDITDVDLYLYGRSSSVTRQRINVDIKNKKTPQAFERILWANGVKQLLNFDSCIVATTDYRPVIHKFAQMHSTSVLDGNFLSKLRSNSFPNRYSEEEITDRFSKHKSFKTFNNRDWRHILEDSKSRLLSELDFSGFNSALFNVKYFITKALTDIQRQEDAIRISYIIISHLLITMDYILKDVAFLDSKEKEKKLNEGLKFGNLGKEGVDRIISIAVQIAGNKSANTFLKSLDSESIDILKEFFSKNEHTKHLFTWARQFENLAYNKEFLSPEHIDSSLKSIVSLLLDFWGIERKKFFSAFIKIVQNTLPFDEDLNKKKDE